MQVVYSQPKREVIAEGQSGLCTWSIERAYRACLHNGRDAWVIRYKWVVEIQSYYNTTRRAAGYSEVSVWDARVQARNAIDSLSIYWDSCHSYEMLF